MKNYIYKADMLYVQAYDAFMLYQCGVLDEVPMWARVLTEPTEFFDPRYVDMLGTYADAVHLLDRQIYELAVKYRTARGYISFSHFLEDQHE